MKVNNKRVCQIASPTLILLEKSPVIPALGYVLLTVSEMSASATASNGRAYITIKETLDTDGKDYFSACVPRTLFQLLDSLPEQQVGISLAKGQLTVTHNSGKAVFETVPEAEYSKVPEFPSDFEEVAAAAFVDAASWVMPFLGKPDDLVQWAGTANIVEFDGGTWIACTSSQTFTLGMARVDGNIPTSLGIIPNGMMKAAKGYDYYGNLAIASDDRFLHIRSGSMTVSEIKPSCNYPDVASLFRNFAAQPGLQESEVDTNLVANAIKRLLLSKKETSLTAMRFEASDDVLRISFEEGVEEVPVSGDIPMFFANYDHVLKCCGGKCRVRTSEDKKVPVVFTGDDYSFMCTKNSLIY